MPSQRRKEEKDEGHDDDRTLHDIQRNGALAVVVAESLEDCGEEPMRRGGADDVKEVDEVKSEDGRGETRERDGNPQSLGGSLLPLGLHDGTVVLIARRGRKNRLRLARDETGKELGDDGRENDEDVEPSEDEAEVGGVGDGDHDHAHEGDDERQENEPDVDWNRVTERSKLLTSADGERRVVDASDDALLLRRVILNLMVVGGGGEGAERIPR